MRRIAPLLALLLAAGCLSPAEVDTAGSQTPPALEPLTEATLALGKFLALKVPAEDGVTLHVDLQLPEGDGPFPVLLEYTPYSILGEQAWGATAERGVEHEAGFANPLAEFYVPRGYAVGVAHVRGTGESGGCLSVGGPQEGRDGYAIVEHLAEQPWSNGKVALMGTSYVGTTPIETALTNPPHLTTIIPVSAVTEWYRYYFEHGEQRMNGSPPPGASYPDPALWMALGVLPGARTGAASPDDAACVAEFWQNYWLQDDYNAFWEDRNLSKGAGNITAPVLFVQGWGDENVATSVIPRFWSGLQSEKRAWLQQHGHGVPASKEAYYEYEHRWLDHWMLDKANGALDLPTVIVEDNLGTWRAEADWPPVDMNATRLWLAPGGGLTWTSPEEGKASFTDDGVGHDTFHVRGYTTPARELTRDRSYLVFDGEPVTSPMHVAGEPIAHLKAASTATDTQFSVLVYDVDPDGMAKLLTRGYLDARHRESLAEGKDLVPDEQYSFEWVLHPRDHVVEAGHHLRVVVKSSDSYVIPDTTLATNTVFLGPEGSWIDLPLVPVEGRAYMEQAPRPAGWE